MMNADFIQEYNFIAEKLLTARFTFAKTMAHIPHEYTLRKDWSDADICNELGMEAEELVKLKHITGFSKLFENQEYKKAWETKQQIQIRIKFEKENEGK